MTDHAATGALKHRLAALLLVGLHPAATASSAAEPSPRWELTRTAAGCEVWLDGKLFAGYRTDSGGRPVLWPVIGPSGAEMTRSFPIGPPLAGEAQDHAHHRGVWVGYDQVGGFDFWHDPTGEGDARRGCQVHQRFVEQSAEPSGVRLVTENHWVAPRGLVVAEDRRTIVFAAEGSGDAPRSRWIDFTITLRPPSSDPTASLTLGDSKEGFFAIRAPHLLTVDAGRGGRIVSASGRENQAAWGRPAAWVDYQRVAGGQSLGITMMSHPGNFRPTPRWHVRTYGLFAANPFGESSFPPDPSVKQGSVTIPPRGSLSLRYRLLLHAARGPAARTSLARVAKHYDRFAAEK